MHLGLAGNNDSPNQSVRARVRERERENLALESALDLEH